MTSYFSKLRETREYPYRVTAARPYGGLTDILNWTRDNATGEWEWSISDLNNEFFDSGALLTGGQTYEFYFERDSDAVAFSLRWS